MRRRHASGWRLHAWIGALVILPLTAPDASAQSERSRGRQRTFTYFESFENAVENTSADPRDLNGNGSIDCGMDRHCATITSCDDHPMLCDEWTVPLASDADLRLINESAGGNKVSFKDPGGATLPPARGTAEVVGPGSLEVCPEDADGAPAYGIIPDRMDWHIHTVKTPDIDGRNTSAPGTMPKAFRGQNSLHWGRHLRVSTGTYGDTYCLQCLNAFVLDRPGGMTLAARPRRGEAPELSFWHIAEFCDDECFTGFPEAGTADDVGIVEIRAAAAGTDLFGAWERAEVTINPYDGVQDTFYTTPTYEPPDDTSPASIVDPDTTMCFPLAAYVAQGSAKGTDPACGDGDGNGFGDCGNVTSNTARGEAGVGVWALSTFSLSRYAGKRIQIRFIATTLDAMNLISSYLDFIGGQISPSLPPASFDDGWYIDDIRVSGLVR